MHAATGEEAQFAELLKRSRKHWVLSVACVLLASGVALLYAKSQTKIYEAEAMLEIDPHTAQPLGEQSSTSMDFGMSFFSDPREYYETEYKIITSERVLGTVVRDLALNMDPDFGGAPTRNGPGPALEDVVGSLRHRIEVEPIKNSRLLYIKVSDADPRRAKRLADAVASAYIAQHLETAVNATTDAVVWLNGQVDHIKSDLEQNENALYDFKQKNDLPSTSINEASNMLRVEMQELDMALTHTRTRKAEIAARADELSKVSSTNPDDLPASELLASPFLQVVRGQYQQAMKDRNALLAEGKGENHPQVKSLEERLSQTRSALLSEVRNVQGAVARDLAIVTREEQADSALFDATRRRAVDLNMKEIEYHRLDRSREENEKLYALLLERMKQADLSRMMHVNNARIVDVAREPKAPVRPRVSVIVSMGTVLGLLVGLAAAILREQFDTSLKTPADIEGALGVTFLGLLPELRDPEEGGPGKRRRRRAGPTPQRKFPVELVVHEHPMSGIAEAARSIRTNLLFMNPDHPYRKLLVSSAGPGEGKTTVACSIAIALAQGGQRVCIVDCDLRRPRLHRVFDRRGDAGLTNLLVGEATIDDVAKPTGIDNLWSIPSGPTPPNPADMLSSERFRMFMSELATRFDRVIVDSPPLVAVTDAAILSTLVDGTVFVVRAFQTSRHLSAQGLRSLHDVEAPVVGAVLNAVNLNKHEYDYYYHYYYYKREGYRASPSARGADDDAEAEKPAAPN